MIRDQANQDRRCYFKLHTTFPTPSLPSTQLPLRLSAISQVTTCCQAASPLTSFEPPSCHRALLCGLVDVKHSLHQVKRVPSNFPCYLIIHSHVVSIVKHFLGQKWQVLADHSCYPIPHYCIIISVKDFLRRMSQLLQISRFFPWQTIFFLI